jgi:hypothetical protein
LGASDGFGSAVGLSGTTAVIGSYGHNNDEGAVYVFAESGGTWTQQQQLTASDGAANDFFGNDLAILGNTLIIGARYHATSAGQPGAAYIFTQSGGTWTQQQELMASNPSVGDEFGSSVALTSDNIIVGAFHVDGQEGAAYLFVAAPPVETPETPWAPLIPLAAVIVLGGWTTWHRRGRRQPIEVAVATVQPLIDSA